MSKHKKRKKKSFLGSRQKTRRNRYKIIAQNKQNTVR